jgi:hypothetical protein
MGRTLFVTEVCSCCVSGPLKLDVKLSPYLAGIAAVSAMTFIHANRMRGRR